MANTDIKGTKHINSGHYINFLKTRDKLTLLFSFLSLVMSIIAIYFSILTFYSDRKEDLMLTLTESGMQAYIDNSLINNIPSKDFEFQLSSDDISIHIPVRSTIYNLSSRPVSVMDTEVLDNSTFPKSKQHMFNPQYVPISFPENNRSGYSIDAGNTISLNYTIQLLLNDDMINAINMKLKKELPRMRDPLSNPIYNKDNIKTNIQLICSGAVLDYLSRNKYDIIYKFTLISARENKFTSDAVVVKNSDIK